MKAMRAGLGEDDAHGYSSATYPRVHAQRELPARPQVGDNYAGGTAKSHLPPANVAGTSGFSTGSATGADHPNLPET